MSDTTTGPENETLLEAGQHAVNMLEGVRDGYLGVDVVEGLIARLSAAITRREAELTARSADRGLAVIDDGLRLAKALGALGRHNIPVDVQEMLVYGAPERSIRPDALATALGLNPRQRPPQAKDEVV